MADTDNDENTVLDEELDDETLRTMMEIIDG